MIVKVAVGPLPRYQNLLWNAGSGKRYRQADKQHVSLRVLSPGGNPWRERRGGPPVLSSGRLSLWLPQKNRRGLNFDTLVDKTCGAEPH